MRSHPKEQHRISRIGWLRAAVLGANDGIVSTASLVLGVAGAHATHPSIVTAALAGLVGGPMSMATGEYVSVSSQADTRKGCPERGEGRARRRRAGRSPGTRRHLRQARPPIALGSRSRRSAHAARRLGGARPRRAGHLADAGGSSVASRSGIGLQLCCRRGAASRGCAPYASPSSDSGVAGAALVALAGLGSVAARTGGAPLLPGILRVTFWSALAMAITAGAGALFGAI